MSISSTTKKSLLISVLTILLCVSLLTGTTLAWFTNIGDANVTVNATSGMVDVDIVDINDSSLVGDLLDFVTTANNPATRLEPGVTFYTVGFKIKNVGNVKMKYTISVNIDKTKMLYKALDFGIIESHENADGDFSKSDFSYDNRIPISEYEGYLDPDKASKTYHLVMSMKTDAGNEYQGLDLGRMGITVMATQSNAD